MSPLNSTATTGDVYAILRDALLSFQPAGGYPTLLTRLDGRMYVAKAPDSPHFPYATLRLSGQEVSGAYNGMRKSAALEIQLVGKPWSMLRDLEQAADVAEAALGQLRYTTDGLMFSRSTTRDTLAQMMSPADAEVCVVRVVASVIMWPKFLTRYTITL